MNDPYNTKSSDDNYNARMIGIFAGYRNQKTPVKFWLTYYIDVEYNDSSSSGKTDKGNGYSIGIGYTGIDYIDINIEYRIISVTLESFKDITNAGASEDDLNTQELILSISFPFTFE